MNFVGFAAMMATVAAPLAAPEVVIHPGETVTVSLSGSSATILKREPAAEMTDFEANLLRRMQMTDVAPDATFVPPVPVYKGEIPNDPPKAKPNVIQFTFRHVAGEYRGTSEEHSMLTIANGYEIGLRYRATIEKGGRREPTDVCGVMPGTGGAEHWPYSIEALDLTNLRFEKFEASHLPCE